MRLFWIFLFCVALPLGAIAAFTIGVIDSAEVPEKPAPETYDAEALAKLESLDWRRVLGETGKSLALERGDGSWLTQAEVAGILASAVVTAAEMGREPRLRAETIHLILDLTTAVGKGGGETAVIRTILHVAGQPADWSGQIQAVAMAFLAPAHEIAKSRVPELQARLASRDGDRARTMEELKFWQLIPQPTRRTQKNWQVLQEAFKSYHE